MLAGSAVLVLAALRVGGAQAQQIRDLAPFLIDLPGWENAPVSATNLGVGLMVQREYTYQAARVLATIATGSLDASAPDPDHPPATAIVDGFRLEISHDADTQSGTLVVHLLDDEKRPAVFSLEYDGVTDGEALNVARLFDWPGLQRAVQIRR